MLVLSLLLTAPILWAETEADTAQAPVAPPADLDSPRAAMAKFLHAMNDVKRGSPGRIDDATAALDLGAVSALVRKERGRDLAWTLLEVLDRTRQIDLKRIPARRTGAPYLFEAYPAGRVEISRGEDGGWRFSQATLAALQDILDGLSGVKSKLTDSAAGNAFLPLHLRIRQALPEPLRQRSFVLENWQWLALLGLILVGVAVDYLITRGLRSWTRRWRARQASRAELSEDLLRPFGLVAMAAVWWLGLRQIGLSENALLILLVAAKFLASIAAVWAAFRMVDVLGAWLQERAGATENKIDDAVVPMAVKTLRIFVVAIGLVFTASNLNFDVTGLLAGLGLGGLAFALAAKDMVQNLFGSVTVLMDRTFAVGDWIKVGDVEGTVEHLGFRSTRVRTFYNSQVTVPNSLFITAEVDNMGERRFRRMSTKLGLTYDTTPEKIDAFCEGLRELVRLHPYMRKDYYHVYFNGYGPSALEILVYVFWETPDWGTELRERHRFLLDILRLSRRLGVEFAYPTQTVYLQRSEAGSETASEGDSADLARQIVEQHTGLEARPDPVRF